MLKASLSHTLCTQAAEAAKPVDLGKRQRKKISYNEANLARDRHTSTSDSEYHGSEADENNDDEDGSDPHTKDLEAQGEEGRKVGVTHVLHSEASSTGFLQLK